MKVLVCDLDGTLINDSSKEKLKPEEYYTNSNVQNLPPNRFMIKQVENSYDYRSKIYFLTGRSDTLKPSTKKWLEKEFPWLKNPTIIMRPSFIDHTRIIPYKTMELIKIVKANGNDCSYEIYDNDEEMLKISKDILKDIKDIKLGFVKSNNSVEFLK